MHLKYPLEYNLGNLTLIENHDSILSKVLTVFDTFLGERVLSPQIGINPNILYSSINELVTRQIETQLNLIEGMDYSLILNNSDGNNISIDLKIKPADGTETFLSIPINI